LEEGELEAGETEHERAQLWALYFQLRSLAEPPPFLRRTAAELRRHLGVDGSEPEPPAGLPVRGHLRLVE
jgi:hypothetical protein